MTDGLSSIIDDAVLAYVEWREACDAVWTIYGLWASGAAHNPRCAHAAYQAALDREEAAARVYAQLISHVADRVAG